MKHFFLCFFVLCSFSAYAKGIRYVCSNKSISEDETYYLNRYFVSVDPVARKAFMWDTKGQSALDRDFLDLKPFPTKDVRLIGSLRATMWHDSGCGVDAYLTKEMLMGQPRAFLKVKSELECRSSGAWLACLRIK